MMRLVLLIALTLMLCAVVTGADKPNLSGSWRMEGHTDSPVVTIRQEGTELNIRSAPANPDDATDVTCNTMGKQCRGKLSGDDAKVSYWFNGSTLVEMAVEDKNRVTETRRRLSDDGKKMMVEVIPIAPGGRTRATFVLLREEQIASGNATAAQQ